MMCKGGRRESGAALIESIVLGLVLTIPIVWGSIVVGELHRAALASTGAAREAAADAARTGSVAQARSAVDRAVTIALENHGLDPRRARIDWSTRPGLPRGSAVELEVAYPVRLLRIPFVGTVGGPTIWVRAVHSARVDLFRSR